MTDSKEVIIYSTPTCHYCQMAKAFFQNNSVTYTEHNVAEDADKRQEMIELTGQMGVPVIKVGDEILVGFNEGKIREMIGMS
jgi:glutaredoxin 3